LISHCDMACWSATKLALLFFIAVFGIYLGWFSPTEAAARHAPRQRGQGNRRLLDRTSP
jgi:TRAP-type C4-dicarboxylate transport system permease large subunit